VPQFPAGDQHITDGWRSICVADRNASRRSPRRARRRLISGYADDARVRNGVLHADIGFLQKPFSPSAIGRKVREILDR